MLTRNNSEAEYQQNLVQKLRRAQRKHPYFSLKLSLPGSIAPSCNFYKVLKLNHEIVGQACSGGIPTIT